MRILQLAQSEIKAVQELESWRKEWTQQEVVSKKEAQTLKYENKRQAFDLEDSENELEEVKGEYDQEDSENELEEYKCEYEA
jgi:chromosome segregation ATPase